VGIHVSGEHILSQASPTFGRWKVGEQITVETEGGNLV
jgi:hypothetical protein